MSVFFPVFPHDPLDSPETLDLLLCSPDFVQGAATRAAQMRTNPFSFLCYVFLGKSLIFITSVFSSVKWK